VIWKLAGLRARADLVGALAVDANRKAFPATWAFIGIDSGAPSFETCIGLLSSVEMFSRMTLPQKRCCGLENCTPDVLLQAELTLLNWRNSLSC
jgi:hypothetical protein